MKFAHNQNYHTLVESMRSTIEQKIPMQICGMGSKSFYGNYCNAQPVDVLSNTGIIEYEPSELFITVRAGTSIEEINSVLGASGQYLPFDPPLFSGKGTIGGALACGLSGPSRPYRGGVRDYVLGLKCLNGKGQILTFGGQVIKNVAGYDVARLMCGALGTLGLLLEVSLKVMPQPECTLSLAKDCDLQQAFKWMQEWQYQLLPVSGMAYHSGCLFVRLSGSRAAVSEAALKLQCVETAESFWDQLRDHKLAFFQQKQLPLWCIHVPRGQYLKGIDISNCLIDWGGGQYWLFSAQSEDELRELTGLQGGFVTLFRSYSQSDSVFTELDPVLLRIQKKLKQAFDPDRLINPGKMYPEC